MISATTEPHANTPIDAQCIVSKMNRSAQIFTICLLAWVSLHSRPVLADTPVQMYGLRPADYCPPAEIKNIVVVARPETEDANQLVGLLHDDLRYLNWYEGTDLARSQLAFNKWREQPIGRNEAKELCAVADGSGILVLESLTTRKGQKIVASQTTSSISTDVVAQSMKLIPLLAANFSATTTNTTSSSREYIDAATAHWGLYDCSGKVLTSMHAKGNTLVGLNAQLIRHLHPTRTVENRFIMSGPGVDKYHGYRSWQLDDYLEAAKAWISAAETLKGMNKIRALNNAAIAFEASGRHTTALRTARHADNLASEGDYPPKVSVTIDALIDKIKKAANDAQQYQAQRKVRSGQN